MFEGAVTEGDVNIIIICRTNLLIYSLMSFVGGKG